MLGSSRPAGGRLSSGSHGCLTNGRHGRPRNIPLVKEASMRINIRRLLVVAGMAGLALAAPVVSSAEPVDVASAETDDGGGDDDGGAAPAGGGDDDGGAA